MGISKIALEKHVKIRRSVTFEAVAEFQSNWATGAAATGEKAAGLAAMRAAATGAAPPAKRLKSAVFASRASARSPVVFKRREGCHSGSFALESPKKIRGIEEMDEELSYQFEDGELQR